MDKNQQKLYLAVVSIVAIVAVAILILNSTGIATGEATRGGRCGDGVVNVGETCDDDDTRAGDGCSSICQVEVGYSCAGQPSVCGLACGNGVINAGEACDDRNARSHDGCSSSCQVEPLWVCTGQPSVCEYRRCGDGIISPLGADDRSGTADDEECDDDNTNSGDGCSSTCQIEARYRCTGQPSFCRL